MKKNVLLLVIMIAIFSQLICIAGTKIVFKKDLRPRTIREDDRNRYKSDVITSLDLVKALELSGISINKFPIGPFDTTYHLFIVFDEYKSGHVIKSDSIDFDANIYYYKNGGKETFYADYIDQLTFISKISDTIITVQIEDYNMLVQRRLIIKKFDDQAIYLVMPFTKSKWKVDTKIPLLACVSSWNENGHQRLCGIGELKMADDRTKKMLETSPHYYLISYLAQKIE